MGAESALGRFYDREVLPRISANPNAIAGVIGLDLGWEKRKNGLWRATIVPSSNPWGVKKDASRIIFKTEDGHLGPYVHPNQKRTWLQLAARSGSYPTGEARAEAIKALGDAYGLSPPTTLGRCVAEYPFSTVEKVEVRQLRYESGEDDKWFIWQRPRGNSWVSGLNGLHPRLYREDEVRQAIARGETVDLFEGCKKADVGRSLGLAATTSPNVQRLADHHLEALRSASRVRLHPDADIVGRDYVLEVGSQLLQIGVEVYVVELYPHQEDGSDLADWVQGRNLGRDEARAFFSLMAQPFREWAEAYGRMQPLHGLLEDLDEVVPRPGGRKALRGLAKEIRTVRTARGAQTGPFVEWVGLQLRENSPSIEVEILEAALAFEQVEGGDNFGTEPLRQFMLASDPGRWCCFNARAEITRNHVGQVLNRVGVESRDVWVDGHSLRKRRFSDVHRAAEQRGIPVESSRPRDPEKEQESRGLATLTPSKPTRTKDSRDPRDSGSLIGVPREAESFGRDLSEERAGLGGRPSEGLERLIEAFDPDIRDDFEERAAILEFCGEMPRAEAEARAYALVAGARTECNKSSRSRDL